MSKAAYTKRRKLRGGANGTVKGDVYVRVCVGGGGGGGVTSFAPKLVDESFKKWGNIFKQ